MWLIWPDMANVAPWTWRGAPLAHRVCWLVAGLYAGGVVFRTRVLADLVATLLSQNRGFAGRLRIRGGFSAAPVASHTHKVVIGEAELPSGLVSSAHRSHTQFTVDGVGRTLGKYCDELWH